MIRAMHRTKYNSLLGAGIVAVSEQDGGIRISVRNESPMMFVLESLGHTGYIRSMNQSILQFSISYEDFEPVKEHIAKLALVKMLTE